MVRFMPEDLPAHEKELTIGEYKLVGDMVWRKLGYTKSNISIPICKIYGETDAIRERIFVSLFSDGLYSPLAHASVEPIPQSHPEAPEVFGYDVRKGGCISNTGSVDCSEISIKDKWWLRQAGK